MTISKFRMTNYDRERVRSNSVRSVLEKTDRILSGRSVPNLKVEILDSTTPAPAYTDGKKIYINSGWEPMKSSLEKGFTPQKMLIVTALNYHELAHCLFMPRLNTNYVKKVREHGAFQTFNILQDQVDETRFVQLYDPAKKYFTSLVANYMLETKEHVQSNYLLVSGRKFIPKSIREKLASQFIKPDLIPEIDHLVSAYKLLAFPADQAEMLKVLLDLHRLINPPSDFGRFFHDHVNNGEPDKKTSAELAEEDDSYLEEEEQDELEEAQGEPEEAEEGEDTPADPGDESEEDEPEAASSDKTSEGGGGSSGSDANKSAEEELLDALEDAVEDALEDLGEEVQERITAVNDNDDYTVRAEEEMYSTRRPDHELISVVERCVEEFREASDKQSPGWHINQRHGKLNHRQYARALRGNEHVFRRWKEGVNDSMDFEVVFLLDQSYSMSGTDIGEASKALWVLSRAFEELDGVVTVLGFHNDVTILFKKDESTNPREVRFYETGGGTNATSAITEAAVLLGVSRKPLKLIVIITDGEFNNRSTAIQEMLYASVPVVMIGIRTDVDQYNDVPNVIHAQRVKEPKELVGVVKEVALKLSDDRINRRS